MAMNEQWVEGIVGRDAQLKATSSGHSVLEFPLAWNDYRNGKAGPTTWFSVTVWGKFAEALNGKIAKGQKVIVKGRTELQTWESKDGKPGAKVVLTADFVRILQKQEAAAAAMAYQQASQALGGDNYDAFSDPSF